MMTATMITNIGTKDAAMLTHSPCSRLLEGPCMALEDVFVTWWVPSLVSVPANSKIKIPAARPVSWEN